MHLGSTCSVPLQPTEPRSALLLVAEAASDPVHEQQRCDRAPRQTPGLHECDTPLPIVGWQEAVYALGKMIKAEREGAAESRE